jgi:hypothetical protein
VPALLTMLGERSWLIPRWLDKALPNLTVEPPGTIEHDVPSVTREPQPEPEPA